MTETTTKRNYKKTLNLPKTGFPMRANLAQNEPGSLKRWGQAKLYEQVIETRREAEPFVFHDGPPYASGSLHAGHLLNKVLKDIVVRSKLMAGRKCEYVPGWDCHGLPIEHKVMADLMASGKADKINQLDDDARRMAIRRECRKSAEKFVKLQRTQMERILTLADYENPYLTLSPYYEQAVLEVFVALLQRNVVYRALKPVHWSIANQTALADAELEYEDRQDLSIYVDFEAENREAVAEIFSVELDQTPSFMIWTTTPWTLPANLAIAVHERFTYALVKVDGNYSVIAKDLVERVTTTAKAESVEVIAETPGAKLVGLKYRHTFCDRVSPIVAAEYVTLEDGTGLVHTAPGHGVEDYQTGQREKLEVYCPVQGDGTFDETVPDWLRGMSVWDANEKITEHLRQSGHLFYSHTFTHSYPHDWRSKTPVIFRCTEQWFIGVDTALSESGDCLRTMALKATENQITFIPQWGRNRMRGMLESRPDWCISRQRAWGLPIPAFRLPNGEMFMTAASVQAVAEAFGKRGSDAWFTESPSQLLESYSPDADPEAPDDLDIDSLEKTYDIFDVWFESGSSWNAVMRKPGRGYPIDLYLEGSDQHRGWFQLSLMPGLGVTGTSPFKSVLTHGFIVDKDGRKMSKSGVNALDIEQILKHYGADVCRWWVSSLSYENDVKGDLSFFEVAGESYRKVRNTLRFLLSNLDNFTPCTQDKPDGMCVDLKSISPASINAYVLSECAKLQVAVIEAYEKYEFRKANNLLYDFCNETLSAFYCAAVKDRLYCDKQDSLRRRTTQTVMWDLLEVLCRLLAPILPHTADETYRVLLKDENRCVHLETHVMFNAPPADPDWSKALQIRDDALKALEESKSRGIENPLDAALVVPDTDGVLKKFAPDMADMCGVSRVTFSCENQTIEVIDLRDEPRCERSWKRDGTVSERSDGGMLSDRDAEAVGV